MGWPGVKVQYSYELLLVQLGARLKGLRKERGWTLRDMVIQHGFHLTHWQSFERGNRGMSLPSLLRIAEVFGVTPSDLLKGLGVAAGTPAPPPPPQKLLKPPKKGK
jgi:transcriptional regulator with XRE-family HTH domain